MKKRGKFLYKNCIKNPAFFDFFVSETSENIIVKNFNVFHCFFNVSAEKRQSFNVFLARILLISAAQKCINMQFLCIFMHIYAFLCINMHFPPCPTEIVRTSIIMVRKCIYAVFRRFPTKKNEKFSENFSFLLDKNASLHYYNNQWGVKPR